MQRETSDRFGFRVVKIAPWQLALGAAVLLALGLTLAVVATGIFLIAFPLVLLVGAAYRLFGARAGALRARQKAPRGDARVIEGEYTVIEPSDRP